MEAPAVHLIVADTYNDAIRMVDGAGIVTTIAGGSGPGFRDGTGPSAQFDTPSGVAVLRDGTLLVADTGNSLVRRVTPSGEVTTAQWLPIDANSDVSLYRPTGIAAARDGSFYVTDRRARILQVLRDGHARVLAGGAGGFADGQGPHARFHNPTGIALDREGALIVADAGNYLLRRITPPGLYAPEPPRSPLAPPPGLPTAIAGAAPAAVASRPAVRVARAGRKHGRGARQHVGRTRALPCRDRRARERGRGRARGDERQGQCTARRAGVRHAQREPVGGTVHLRARPRRARAEGRSARRGARANRRGRSRQSPARARAPRHPLRARRPDRHGEPLQPRAPERGHARTRGQPAPAATRRVRGHGAADDRARAASSC